MDFAHSQVSRLRPENFSLLTRKTCISVNCWMRQKIVFRSDWNNFRSAKLALHCSLSLIATPPRLLCRKPQKAINTVLPWAIGPVPVMMVVDVPTNEPPDDAQSFDGFIVRKWSTLTEVPRRENSGVMVRPMTMAPARSSELTTGKLADLRTSLNELTPFGVAQSCWSIFSFMVIGIPCKAEFINKRDGRIFGIDINLYRAVSV